MATFYGSESNFETYAEERGYTISDGDIEPALLRASIWVDSKYGSRFIGTKTGGRDQERAWPRTGAYDAEGNELDDAEVPNEIVFATYEAARQELSSPGSLLPVVTPGKAIKKVSVEGAVSVEYANTGAADQLPSLPIVDGILSTLFSASNVDNSLGLFGVASRV